MAAQTVGSETVRCAVRVGGNPEDEQALAALLRAHTAWKVTRFAAKDEDELNAELCAGRFEIVVFANLEALLAAMWKGDAAIDRWRAAGVQLELTSQPSGDVDWRVYVHLTHQSLEAWRAATRRRQILACSILSALALIAAAAVLWWIPTSG